MSDDLFEPFPKISRLNRKCMITEKIDGTNAQVFITSYNTIQEKFRDSPFGIHVDLNDEPMLMFAGSRNRWLSIDNDNYGFAGWVNKNRDELVKLGEGRHFGEWWGNGIQRGYGMKQKYFSLFNVNRWRNETIRPSCCSVVPILFEGDFSSERVNYEVNTLNLTGSVVAPGFSNPEGVVVFHCASRELAKVTCKNDHERKTVAEKKVA